MSRLFAITLLAMIVLPVSTGQWNYSYQYGALPQSMLDMIAGEASGERAYADLVELTGYNRVRPPEEYATTLYESTYIIDKLRSYGIENATIERLGRATTWKGLEGTLWEVSPVKTKIADYEDLPLMLASGSRDADVTAPLVWVGEGTASLIEAADTEGAILLTSGALSRVFPLAMAGGAHGVVTFESARPLIDPLQIPTGGIRGRVDRGFAFRVPPRDGHRLRDRLLRGENIEVHARVRTTELELDIQVPMCVIEGTDEDAEEIIITAHIFEGYVKQGANDNGSGSVAILDVARLLHTMYNDGRLPRPRRSVRFLWVPEFQGTIPWVEANSDIMERTLCNLNLDMVGISQAENQSFMVLHRTTFGNPHYVNDVLQMYMRYISETNKIRCTPVGRFPFLRPIVAPTGTDDPFYWTVEAYISASDHAVFNNFSVGVPGICLNNWPDHYYHTSNDRPWICDPTQLKRVIFLAAASAYTIASADGDRGLKIAAEVAGNAAQRMGHQMTISADRILKSDKADLQATYKRALYDYQAVSVNQAETIMSLAELAPDDMVFITTLEEMAEAIGVQRDAGLRMLDLHMKRRAAAVGSEPVVLQLTEEERQLDSWRPVVTAAAYQGGYSGYRSMIQSVPADFRQSHNYRSIRNIHEFLLLANGERSALEMMKLYDAQYPEPAGTEQFTNALLVLREAGVLAF